MSEVIDSGAEAPVETPVDAQSTPVEGEVSQDQIQETIENAIEEGATKEEIKEMIKEYDLKVNGKSKKVKLNLSDDKEVVRRLQLAEAGQLAMQEKAQLEKLIDQALMNAKNDPWSFLKELGLDPDDLAERRISDKVEELKKSPEQVEREAMQKELEMARKQLKQIETEKQEAIQKQLQSSALNEIDKDITEALAEDPELPKTKKTVARIADALLWAIDNGFPDATVKDVLPAVKSELRLEMDDFLSNMNDDLLENWIGKKNIERMRKKRLAAVKAQPKAVMDTVKQVSKPEEKTEKQREQIAASNFFRKLR